MYDQYKNVKHLQVINTARSQEKINEAAKMGLYPLVKPVEPSERVHNMVAVFQNVETGEIELSGDMRYTPDGNFSAY